jgi:probable HAF family extracellular repeat protein
VTDIGTLGGTDSAALGISPDTAFPRFAGLGQTASGHDHAFSGNPFHTIDLGTLGGLRSEARAIDSNRVVGLAQNASGAYHAFLALEWQNGLTDLGTLGGLQSFANAIAFQSATSSFLVVGGSATAGNAARRAFLYDTGTGVMSELPATLGGTNTVSTGINGQGHVVGSADLAGGSTHHAFLFANGVTQDLGSLGTNSDATAINDSDVVVGFSETLNGSGGGQHAFRYQNGVMQDLGTLGGTQSGALAVNASGVIVGWAHTSQGNPHAFIWRNGVMTDLNTLIPAGAGWELLRATGITPGNAGREAITGIGQFQGHVRAFFLTPPLDLGIQLHPHFNQLDTNIPNPHEAGQTLPMGVTVWNNEAFSASNVTVTDSYTGPVQIDAWSGADSCTQNGLQLTCTFNRVDGAGNGRDLIVKLRATGPGVITHAAAIVSADQPDPNRANNSTSTESNTAVSLAKLELTKTTAVGGESVLSRATLTSPAPTGGATVKLTSSRPDIASVPSQFDVLRGCCDGGLWREFYVTTKAVSAPVTVQISASYGLVTKTVPLTITPSATPTPFGGSAWPIPGTIQAENFDDGGEGVAYHDTSTGNKGGAYRSTDVDIEATSDAGGGHDVGWMAAG